MTDQYSSAFELYDPRLQRWIWQQQWDELHDIQEQAAVPILDRRDVLISSATASGKTEAAFLPICTALGDDAAESLGVIYISPLKALINDQRNRLESLFGCVKAPVTPWHGDVSAHIKRRVLTKPQGALLITPESIEALFVMRGPAVPRLVKGVQFIVVDELHAFVGNERGRQLQSLMQRLEFAVGRRIPRIGLSATLGELDVAAEFLRPKEGNRVEQVASSTLGREVRMQVRGYRQVETMPNLRTKDQAKVLDERTTGNEEHGAGDDIDVSRHLFDTLRGQTNLVFCNQRSRVELFADLLRRHGERLNGSNEFWAHHGNLSREIREEAENRLRGNQPATVVATTTLELGIDIGAVDSIAQIGPPISVASLKQRLGRSGRKHGSPSVIRIYVQEPELVENTPPNDHLRVSLVQSIAMIRLLLNRWVEPPPPNALHLSTLVQQLLSLTAQYGGFKAVDAYRMLCSSGPFDSIDPSKFGQLLRDLVDRELLTQTHDGTIVLDMPGERMVNHFEFFAAFTTREEWRIVADARSLGTLPVSFPLVVDMYLIFAGRRWRITAIDENRREVQVAKAAGGRTPRFEGTGGLVHDRVREEMRRVYLDDDNPVYLDSVGRELLAEGRKTFERFNLRETSYLARGRDTYIFPWVGDRVLNTLALQLRQRGVDVAISQPSLVLNRTSHEEARGHIEELAGSGIPDAEVLAASVENKRTEKHHIFLGEELLNADYASSQLDAGGAWRTTDRLTARAKV